MTDENIYAKVDRLATRHLLVDTRGGISGKPNAIRLLEM
jgi:hypothetical protein